MGDDYISNGPDFLDGVFSSSVKLSKCEASGAGVRVYKIKPNTKPRMTQSDKWKKRPATTRYWAFKDEVRRLGIKVPASGSHIIFHIPMPHYWAKKKKAEYDGQPHQSTPDKDNLEKALLDAIYDKDEHIWDSRVSKLWAYEGAIEIKTIMGAKL